MLHAVRYVKAAGGIGPMLDVEGGAQQDRFPEGTQQIALRMAEALGERVRSRRRGANASRTATGPCRRALVGRGDAPRGPSWSRSRPHTAARSLSNPTLPDGYAAAREELAAGQSEQGLRRLRDPVLADRRPLGRGAVRRRAGVHHLRRQPRRRRPRRPARLHRCAHVRPAARRRQAQGGVGRLRRAVRRRRPAPHRLRRPPVGHRGVRTRWPDRGGAPGSWTSYGHWLREPVDGIFWAGTETADQWTGFLDGAVRSGQRAAAEVDGYLAATS